MQTKDTVSRINAAIAVLRDALEKELVTLEDQLRINSGDIHKKVQERKSIARELALDKKLIEIFEEVRHYPAFAARPGWTKYRMCEVDDPKEEKRDHEHVVSFTLNDKQYSMTYIDQDGSTGFDGDYFHHTKLALADQERRLLIEVNISVEYDYISILKPFDISAFIPGKWVQDILECYERLVFNKKQKDLLERYDEGKVQDLKNKFGLDE